MKLLMYKQIVLFILLFFIGGLACEKCAGQTNRPNVVMLVVDDWNDMIAAFGNRHIETPNIDKLCARGVRFVNNHTSATYCTPSRTALMTGVAPWKSGCYADQPHHYNMPNRKTIPMLFQENGYSVLGGGKIYHHMPGYLDLKGFDEYFHWDAKQKKRGWGLNAWEDNLAAPKEMPASEFGKKVYANFDIKALPNHLEAEMADTKVCNWAIDQINKKHEKPFFIAVGIYAPHKPNYAPLKYFDKYPLDSINIPAVKEHDEKDLPPLVQKIIQRKSKHTHNKLIAIDNGWKKAVQGYMACISYADAQLGRVLEALENSPHANNTIVLFWSDNGYQLGEKKCWAKHTLWERTTNVPLIWAGPGIAKNKAYNEVTSLLDIYPTLIEMCNLKNDPAQDGESIVRELKYPEKLRERMVITADKKGDSFSVFTSKWHYIQYKNGKAEELYNVIEDPQEWENLAMHHQYAHVKKELAKAVPVNPAAPAVTKKQLRLKLDGEKFEWKKREK
ncbi:iduronate sulfatase [Prolixibacteraceae bacterium JC049]|nr:iduronate sulfatase [Prolixibacteraceae bacterium JC049]